MKIVLDTNVLISGLIKEGKPRDLLREILLNHELVISREILEEVAAVANEPRIRRYVDHKDLAEFLRGLASSASIVKVKSKFRVVKQDPDDDTILRTAVDGRAKLVV
jgi:putative PIN family toxin of toxin-antitoxin system